MFTVVCIILAISIAGLILSFFVLIPALDEGRDSAPFMLIIVFLLCLLILVSGGYLEERNSRIQPETVAEVDE